MESRRRTGQPPEALGVVMVVRVMMVMMVASGECGTCTRNQQEGGKDKLLHGLTVARRQMEGAPLGEIGTKTGTGAVACRWVYASGVDWKNDASGRFPRPESQSLFL